MNILNEFLLNSEHIRQLNNGLITGAFASFVGLCLFTTSESSNKFKSPIFKNFEYILIQSKLSLKLQDLEKFLQCNGRLKDLQTFHEICSILNLFQGYDLAIDLNKQLDLDLNYTAAQLHATFVEVAKRILDQQFRLPALGCDIVDIIEELEEVVKNIVFNISQEIQIQINR
jgi:hypothetical protein